MGAAGRVRRASRWARPRRSAPPASTIRDVIAIFHSHGNSRQPLRALRPLLLSARGGSAWNQHVEISATPATARRTSGSPPGYPDTHDLRWGSAGGYPVAILRQGLRPHQHDRQPRPGRPRLAAHQVPLLGDAARAQLAKDQINTSTCRRFPGTTGRRLRRLVQSRGRPQRAPPGQLIATDVRALHRERIDCAAGSGAAPRSCWKYEAGRRYDPRASAARRSFTALASEFRPCWSARTRDGGRIRPPTLDFTSILPLHRGQLELRPAGAARAKPRASRPAFDFSSPPAPRVSHDERRSGRGRGGDTRASASGQTATPSARLCSLGSRTTGEQPEPGPA